MATYKYLEPATPFTATEINTRFDQLIGENQGLNTISLEDCLLGAFRHTVLPRLLHSSEHTTLLDADAFTSETNVTFDTVRSNRIIQEHEFDTAITLDMSLDQNVGAILVLANVNVMQFGTILERWTLGVGAGDRLGGHPNETLNEAEFYLEIESLTETVTELPHTIRLLSPGVTISSSDNFYVGLSRDDVLTNQDVSIRTVIRSDDLPDYASDVKKIRLMWRNPPFLDGDVVYQTIQYSKSNLTAIPLHAKVTAE
tara:strand:- start:908 stop:1675 length:768 start_codon:yes stop_codon:yes gene_type:complete